MRKISNDPLGGSVLATPFLAFKTVVDLPKEEAVAAATVAAIATVITLYLAYRSSDVNLNREALEVNEVSLVPMAPKALPDPQDLTVQEERQEFPGGPAD
jgi:hypothetical protein